MFINSYADEIIEDIDRGLDLARNFLSQNKSINTWNLMIAGYASELIDEGAGRLKMSVDKDKIYAWLKEIDERKSMPEPLELQASYSVLKVETDQNVIKIMDYHPLERTTKVLCTINGVGENAYYEFKSYDGKVTLYGRKVIEHAHDADTERNYPLFKSYDPIQVLHAVIGLNA